MATPQKIHDDKLKFIFERLDKLKRRVARLEKSLFESINSRLLLFLQVDDNGNIKNNQTNLNYINRVDSIFNDINKGQNLDTVSIFAKDLISVGSKNEYYFRTILNTDVKDKAELIKNRNLKALGIEATKKGSKLTKGGFLDLFLNDETPRNTIKRLAYQFIVNGTPINEFKDTLIQEIVTSERKSGIMDKHYRSYAYETYNSFDRSNAKAWADEFKLQVAQYTKGLESDSRYFCIHNIGKYFLREEIQEWDTLKNKKIGKKVVGPIVPRDYSYNPFIRQGGINCKHGLRWVSNEFALRYDKTLYLDEKGIMRRKDGKNPNNDI